MFLARWVPEVFQVPGVSMDFPDPPEFPVLRDLQARREMRDPPDRPDPRDLLATKAQWDHLGRSDHLAPLVKLVPGESQVYQDYQELTGCLVRMVTLVSLGRRATKAHRVTLDRLAFPDREESRETLVNVELKETRGKRVKSGWRVRKETWV